MHFLPLRTRVKSAFVKAGVKWPSPASRAIPLGGAALQCKTMRSAALICDVVSDNDKLMHRNAVLLVLLCQAAGMDAADTWIAGELRAAVTEARKTTKVVGRTRFTLAIDHPPRLIALKVEERL